MTIAGSIVLTMECTRNWKPVEVIGICGDIEGYLEVRLKEWNCKSQLLYDGESSEKENVK